MRDLEGLPDDAVVLAHQLRIRGLLPDAEDDPTEVLCAAGFAQRKGALLALTPDGRAAHAAWARIPEGSETEATVRRSYDAFLGLNVELLQVSTDWQLRSGSIPNDHSDPTYDWAVIDRLAALDERAGPLVRRVSSVNDRFIGYRPRMREALRRVREGEREWFCSPRCDSYHTVWMQLHEDLLLALGLERAAEELRAG